MKPNIVMQSDFGIDSGLVACMHGICKMVDATLELHDITHLLPPFQITAASYCLQYTVPYWPAGTIFVSVVDPGVGTSRKACVAKLKNGSYVVTPDNGTLSYLADMIGIESVREIDESRNRYEATKDVSTFHGRDLFAYCAAKLAVGIITYEEVGNDYPVEDIVLHEIKRAKIEKHNIETSIQSFDPFGSAELTVRNTEFQEVGFSHGDMLDIQITEHGSEIFCEKVLYEKSFGYVGIGEHVIFNDLASFVTIACNQAGFKQMHNLKEDGAYCVRIQK